MGSAAIFCKRIYKGSKKKKEKNIFLFAADEYFTYLVKDFLCNNLDLLNLCERRIVLRHKCVLNSS